MSGVRINELVDTTSIGNGDYVATDGTQGTRKISFNNLSGKTLDKLTSKEFSDLNTASKNIPGAVNELNARINNIVAPSGDPSLTELQDIRINFLGQTFNTAGDAVRVSDMIASGLLELNYTSETVTTNFYDGFLNIENLKGGRIVALVEYNFSTYLPSNAVVTNLLLNNAASETGAIWLQNDSITLSPPVAHVSDYLDFYHEVLVTPSSTTYGGTILITFRIPEDIEYSYIGFRYTDYDPAPHLSIYGAKEMIPTFSDPDSDGNIVIS